MREQASANVIVADFQVEVAGVTSLIAWIGVDSRGPASVYIATDSRISWSKVHLWDQGRKIFASQRSPEILAYCGDALFPSLALGRAVDLVDFGIMLGPNASPDLKRAAIMQNLADSFEGYPATEAVGFTILYCTRQGCGMASTFWASSIQWNRLTGWSHTEWISVPDHSDVLVTLGTGNAAIQKWYAFWQRTSEGRTSRSVFSAFCDALASGEDPATGGAPQLVGIYREGPARPLGIIYKDDRFLLGARLPDAPNLDVVEWRNTLFERCDPHTMAPLPGANRHGKPRGLATA